MLLLILLKNGKGDIYDIGFIFIYKLLEYINKFFIKYIKIIVMVM